MKGGTHTPLPSRPPNVRQHLPLRDCPWCGRPVLRARDTACDECSDLPALDPLGPIRLGSGR